MDVSGQKMSTRKYFIAIIIPDPFYSEIEGIKQELFERFDLRGALRSPAHITLHRPFEWREDREDLLIKNLSGFSFNEKFEVLIRDFDFFEPRVIFANVAPNKTLENLHTALAQFTQKNLRLFNEIDDKRGFHPHITVAFRDLKKPLFYSLREEFGNRKLSFQFHYAGFALLKLQKKWEILRNFEL
jgi:2'-5' RNA ligase